MPKLVTLQLEDDIYQLITEAAEAENRTPENLIETAALLRIYEQQFADDSETAEIIADKKTDEADKNRLRRSPINERQVC